MQNYWDTLKRCCSYCSEFSGNLHCWRLGPISVASGIRNSDCGYPPSGLRIPGLGYRNNLPTIVYQFERTNWTYIIYLRPPRSEFYPIWPNLTSAVQWNLIPRSKVMADDLCKKGTVDLPAWCNLAQSQLNQSYQMSVMINDCYGWYTGFPINGARPSLRLLK